MPSQLIKTVTKEILQPNISFLLPIRLTSTKKKTGHVDGPAIATANRASDEATVMLEWNVIHANFEAEHGLDFGNAITRQKFKEVYIGYYNSRQATTHDNVGDKGDLVPGSVASSKKRARESDGTNNDDEAEECKPENIPNKKQKVSTADESDDGGDKGFHGYKCGEDLSEVEDSGYEPDDSQDTESQASHEGQNECYENDSGYDS